MGLAADQVFTYALYGLLLAQWISGFRGNGVVSGGNRKVKKPQINRRNTAKRAKKTVRVQAVCVCVCVSEGMMNETLQTTNIEDDNNQSYNVICV